MPPMATTHTHDLVDPTVGQSATLVEYSQALNRLSDEITLLRQRLARAVPLDEALDYRRRAELAEIDADRLAAAHRLSDRYAKPAAVDHAIREHKLAVQARPPSRIDHTGLVGSSR